MEPGPIGAVVYSSRPLEPLPDAVADALESPSREEVLGGPDVGPLWRSTVLRARLVQVFGDHARRCGAGSVLAGGAGILPLASSVADRLGLPLEQRAEGDHAGRRPYLLARVLHEREEGLRFSGEWQPTESAAGAGVLFRVRAATDVDMRSHNVMYIIDL